MSRASLIGAAAITLACGSTTQPQDDGGAKDTGSDSLQGAYGGPPPDASAVDAPYDGPVAAYGGPPLDGGGG